MNVGPPGARRTVRSAALLVLLALGAGCVERLLRVRSDPPGAIVFINGDEVGVTPLEHPFAFYGTVGIVLRKEGHESQRLSKRLSPPWYQYFPLDFFAENVVPWKLEDHHIVDARLEPLPPAIDEEIESDLERRAREARERATRGLEPPPAAGSAAVEGRE